MLSIRKRNGIRSCGQDVFVHRFEGATATTWDQNELLLGPHKKYATTSGYTYVL